MIEARSERKRLARSLEALTSFRSQVTAGVALMLAAVGVLFAPTAGAQEIRPIVFPVDGENFYTDTYGACRSGCTRRHLGVDLIGEKMVPLLAARDGEVTWLRHDSVKGNILTITDDDGWKYHYIHINNDTPGTDDGANNYDEAFAPGIERGVRVTAGQVVAYLGDSGNAEATPPHLHFEIERPDGSNINPTPSVAAAEANGFVSVPAVPSDRLGPFDSFEDLAAEVGTDLFGRSLSPTEKAALANRLLNEPIGDVIADHVDDPTIDFEVRGVARLYEAYFLRTPDAGGFEFWLDSRRGGWTLWEMSDFFAESDEFVDTYGDLDDAAFVELVYQNVMERTPDGEGRDYWIGRLGSDLSRGDLMTFFSDSAEYRGRTEAQTELIAVTWLVNDRIPSEGEIDAWRTSRDGGRGLADAIGDLLG